MYKGLKFRTTIEVEIYEKMKFFRIQCTKNLLHHNVANFKAILLLLILKLYILPFLQAYTETPTMPTEHSSKTQPPTNPNATVLPNAEYTHASKNPDANPPPLISS